MSPEEIKKELERHWFSRGLEVRIDREHARRSRHHPASLQLWDRGVVSGVPYCVFVIERRGFPAEFGPWVLHKLHAMRAENIHQGRKSWAEQYALDQAYAQERNEQRRLLGFREKIGAEKGRMISMLCREKKYHSLNREVARGRS